VLIGGSAFWLDLRLPQAKSAAEPSTRKKTGARRSSPPQAPVRTHTAIAFLSGAFVPALEVLWSRMLAQVHEHSIYSFAIVVTIFLVGLASGARVIRPGWGLRKWASYRSPTLILKSCARNYATRTKYGLTGN
jgi:hypothetical protein